MTSPEQLLQRLDEIAAVLAHDGRAVALLGLGSVGPDLARVDRWSDLDFFVIVEPGAKAAFIDDLWWLASPSPLVWSFRNTADGHKGLSVDGVFYEFAVFEQEELHRIPFAHGRFVWKRDDIDESLSRPTMPLPTFDGSDTWWMVNEALSNLYVGLLRWHRGERLAAMRMIQVYAVDRVIDLMDALNGASGRDPFDATRRIESRVSRRGDSAVADPFADLMGGYGQTPASAVAILRVLERLAPFPLNAEMCASIRSLAAMV
jgi:hypothetical protein